MSLDSREFEQLKSRIDSTDRDLRYVRQNVDGLIQDVINNGLACKKLCNYAVWISGCSLAVCLICCTILFRGS